MYVKEFSFHGILELFGGFWSQFLQKFGIGDLLIHIKVKSRQNKGDFPVTAFNSVVFHEFH